MESTGRYCESYIANNVIVTGKQFKSFIDLISLLNFCSRMKHIFIIRFPSWYLSYESLASTIDYQGLWLRWRNNVLHCTLHLGRTRMPPHW